MTFQSVSPSSIKASVPSTFTLITSPREHTWKLKVLCKKTTKIELKCLLCMYVCPYKWYFTLFPMSHISIGSLSPQHPVSLSWWLGSSHVCEGRETHLKDGRETVDCCGSRTCLWNSSIVPDIAFVRKHICYISKILLLHVLFQWIKRLFGSYLIKDMTQK